MIRKWRLERLKIQNFPNRYGQLDFTMHKILISVGEGGENDQKMVSGKTKNE